MNPFLFILTGIIISLGFIGTYLFKRKGIPDNLLLIFFGILLGPVFHVIEP
jgi:cell volume regulation protein A